MARKPLETVDLRPLSRAADQVLTTITGWISSEPNSFKVAPANYQEILDKQAEACTYCDDKHPIVPGELWTPPENEKFFEWARGARIEVTISPVWKKEEGD